MRLSLAVLCLALAAGLSCLTGYGQGYAGLLTLIVWFLALSVLPERGRQYVWNAMLWASMACAVLALVQLPWQDRPRGPFGSPNYLGAFAAVMVLAAWRQRQKSAALLNLAAVAMSQSRGALLAVGVGAAILVYRRARVWALAAIGVAAIGAGLLWRPEARLAVWATGLQIAAQRPLTGWGIGGVEPLAVIDQRLMMLDHFYSVPLDWLIATGVLGLAAGVWMAIESWRSGVAEDRAVLAAWIVAGLFLSAAWPTWLILFVLMADLVGRDKAHRAGVVDHHQPLLNGRVRALRPE